MAEALILEFSGVSEAQYDAVNASLGVDARTGAGDWPSGLLVHAAGYADDGTFVVTEVWDSREAQGDFMESRLGEALAVGGVTDAPKVTWVSLVSHQSPGL
ncbi:MAG: hypothetical protein U0U69_08410 [Acidimicrobiia bacterium]